VKCAAYRKSHRAFCAGLFGELHHALDAGDFAGHDDLFFRVLIRRNYNSEISARLLAEGLDGLIQFSKNCSHRSGTTNAFVEHQLSTPTHEFRCIRQSRRVGSVIRSVLAE
jgi:hypothetical protein